MRRSLILIPLVVFFIQSCISTALTTVEIGPAVTGTQALPTASLIPSSQESFKGTLYAPTPTNAAALPTKNTAPILTTATPTLTSCLIAGGRVETDHFTTELLPEPMVYRIYLPPCYDEETDHSYPVLYLVHGKNASDMQWDYLGVPETLDRLVTKGELLPFLVVMPRDRLWTEPTVDNFGRAVGESLVPWVDEHYRTLPERGYRAIGGLSWGEAWALHIGISQPELFSAVGSHSGIVFNTYVPLLPDWLKNFLEEMSPRIYLDVGNQDRAENIMEAT